MTAEQIADLAEEYQAFRYRQNPLWAHMTGEYAVAGSYTDVSEEAEDAAVAEARRFAARAEEIAEEPLEEQDRLSRAMLAWDATSTAEVTSLRTAEFSANPIFGAQASLGTYFPKLSLPTRDVADAMPDKLRGIATYFTDLAERHRAGVAAGRTPAAFAVADTIRQLDDWLASPVADDRLLQIAPTPSDVDRDALLAAMRDVVDDAVRPALATYRAVLADEVMTAARPDDQVGLRHVPGGEEAYATLVRYYTTTDLSPQEIHEIGLEQVASLEREYAALGPAVVGTDDVPTVLAALRDDPALHFGAGDGDAIVAASKAAMAKARAAMGEWFGRLPRSDCDVEPTTSGAIAYYFRPALDGSRGGVFFMNVSEPEGWGRYEIESTSFHEGIPGHHLQIAIAQELEGVPDFRKTAFVTAYSEGWGLYTERLADEMGLYGSPLDRMGMRAADSMRACRLVVDTGMHALGWSRQQAIDYLLANSEKTLGHATAEIDRYAVTPRAGALLHGRPARDPADPRRRRAAPGGPVRHQGVPRRGARLRRVAARAARAARGAAAGVRACGLGPNRISGASGSAVCDQSAALRPVDLRFGPKPQHLPGNRSAPLTGP
ncbi:DUF885 domain-containing protein [Nocardioides sp. TF02-7]|uniref:DUF885 domain-containing protein n=1 Tax=Nocardioides sp. TF02-7 TaxID=2917724 RepID=UPI001F05AFDD|nr:DUF885 domain-containing protein [Nocardioides sp. TF02-7]UMG94543.1 DUF885 domain-containing protein [Nocardioides sp. TF02-7]